MVQSDTPGLSCSKPIHPGTGIPLEAGQAVHICCLSRKVRVRAMEAQSTASKLQADADELMATARGLARCVFCEKPLASASLLRHGE